VRLFRAHGWAGRRRGSYEGQRGGNKKEKSNGNGGTAHECFDRHESSLSAG